MDIIVTTPKSESLVSRGESCDEISEARRGNYWSRAYNFKPKVEDGDKVFFTENNYIQGFSLVIGVDYLPEGYFVCGTTDRHWYGNWKMMFNMWFWLPTKPYFQGFRGIRYVPNIKDQKFVRKLYKQVDLIVENLKKEEKRLKSDYKSLETINEIIKADRPRDHVIFKLKRLNVTGY